MSVSNAYILTFVKQFNDFDDTSIFDEKLNLLINAEIGKLANKGIPNQFIENSHECDAYCLCIARAILISLNPNINIEFQQGLLLTETNELRCSLIRKQS